MSFAARIADIDLIIQADPEPSFGSIVDQERGVSFTAYFTGASKDEASAALSKLNRRLAGPCDLVMTPSGSSYPQALRLTGGGAARLAQPNRFDIANQAFVQITAPCAPYATPANRVYLAAPFGDEFPADPSVSRSVVGGISASRYVYAEAGRWVICHDDIRCGVLTLTGPCAAGETLTVDIVARNGSPAVTLTASLTWRDASGSAIGTDAPSVGSIAAGTRARRTTVLTPPTNAASFALALTFAGISGVGDMYRAYVESVEVGRSLPAALVSTPCLIQSPGTSWSAAAWPEHDYARSSEAGVSWGYSAGRLTATCAAVASGTVLLSGRSLRVRPGQQLGLQVVNQMTARTGGAAILRVAFFDEAGAFLGSANARSVGSVDGASVSTMVVVTVPAGAASARAELVTSSSSTWTLWLESLLLTCGMVESPAAVHLDGLVGEHPAALETFGDVDPGSDAVKVWQAIGPDFHAFEAEALTWTGGTTTNVSDDALFGGLGRQNTGTSPATAPIDCQDVREGTYLLLARAASVDGTATVTCAENGGSASTASATPVWLSLGQIVLPPRLAVPGTPATITVGMVSSDAAGMAIVDRFLLIPLTHGGMVSYAGDPVSALDVTEDGAVIVDGLASYGGGVRTGRLMAAAGDRLLVCAEKAASDEATHLVNVFALHAPLYDLWR